MRERVTLGKNKLKLQWPFAPRIFLFREKFYKLSFKDVQAFNFEGDKMHEGFKRFEGKCILKIFELG